MVGTTRKSTMARETILPSIIVLTVASLANSVPNATVDMVMTTKSPRTPKTGHRVLSIRLVPHHRPARNAAISRCCSFTAATSTAIRHSCR